VERRGYEGDWVVSAVLDDRAERYPDECFVQSEEGDLSFGALRERAQRFAGALRALGVEPGDRVATMLDPSLAYLTAWFGCTWAGAVDVPVNTAYKGSFLHHVLAEAEARVLVVDGRWVNRLTALDLPCLEHLVVVDEPNADPALPVLAYAEAAAHEPVGRVQRTERDLVYILYTSGTTGLSKGVMHGNRSALWNARSWIDILELTGDDVAYSMFPLFHVTARSAVVTSSLWAGSQVALRSGFSATGFWDDVRRTGSTWFAYMGAVVQLLHKQPPRPDDADNPARIAFGAAAPPQVMDEFQQRFGVELLEVYGSTELGPASAPRPGRVKRGTMGRPCEHLQVAIHDPDDRPVPTGVRGEIVCRPAAPYGLFAGYWQQPESTLHAFRNLWFHTGDGGYLDDEGYLVFTDRIKDSLRRRGENISSFEVERAVQAHPDVLEAAAYAARSELSEDEVMVAVVPRPGAHLDVEALLRFCADTMPRFAVPRYVRVMAELPKTPSQRVQKYRLRDEGVTPDTLDLQVLGVEVPGD
jgi:carnitine-CoA ligase